MLLFIGTELFEFFQFLYYFISFCRSLSFILLQTFLQLLFKFMKIINKIFQICSTFFHLEFLIVSSLSNFFKSLFTESAFLNEIFSKLFLLMKWVYDSINLWFGFFDSFLKFNKNLFFFLIKAKIYVDNFIFFNKLFGCFDVFFLHLWDIDFSVLEKKILEDKFLLFLLFLLALKFLDGLICIHDNKLKFLDSVFENMNLFLNCRIFTCKLSIFRSNKFELLMKR